MSNLNMAEHKGQNPFQLLISGKSYLVGGCTVLTEIIFAHDIRKAARE